MDSEKEKQSANKICLKHSSRSIISNETSKNHILVQNVVSVETQSG